MQIESSKRAVLVNENDWKSACKPKGWKNGYSAKEMANYWLCPEKQNKFEQFIIKKFPNCTFNAAVAIPEFEARFDKYRNPRKDDLRIFLPDRDGQTIISIEGKVNEPFGDSSFYTESIEAIVEKGKKPKSQKFDRIIDLYRNIFKSNAYIIDIRYQLLYWFAGAISTQNATNIILVVQEFRQDKSPTSNQKRNHDDFNKFISFITQNQYHQIQENDLIGPIRNQYTNGKQLYIGYKICSMRPNNPLKNLILKG